MSKIILAYAVLSVLPIGFLVAMVRSIGIKGALQVLAMVAVMSVFSLAIFWAIRVVVVS